MLVIGQSQLICLGEVHPANNMEGTLQEGREADTVHDCICQIPLHLPLAQELVHWKKKLP